MRHTTARARVVRPVRALLAAVLVMAIGTAPAGVAEPTVAPSAEDSVAAEQLDDASLGTATVDAEPQESIASETTATHTSPIAPLVPDVLTQDGVTVERKGDVDTVHVHDSEGELWQWGWKASEENIFALTRKGEVSEVLSVTADGRELDRNKFGWVNTEDGAFIGFDLNALHTIPPVDVTIEIKADTKGDYAIAESEDIPTSQEFAQTGYDPKEELDLEVEAQLRAAPPGDIWKLPGWQDQELTVSAPTMTNVNNNPELKFTVNESGTWQMTRFAVKKDQNSSNTKAITGPVRIRVVRDGKAVEDRTLSNLTEYSWGDNGAPNYVSNNKEFQLAPNTTDLFFQAGDTIILNPVGPPNGTYTVQLWGQLKSNEPALTGVQTNGNWKQVTSTPTGGEIVSPQHSLALSFKKTPRYILQDDFKLGGAEGASVQKVTYWYEQPGVSLNAANQKYETDLKNQEFWFAIDGIVDTHTMRPTGKILPWNEVVAPTDPGGPIGWEYRLKGFDDLYVRITTPQALNTTDPAKNPLVIEFVNGNGVPVFVDIPANAQTHLRYATVSSKQFVPDPKKARIDVYGYPNAEESTDEGPEITPPLNPSDPGADAGKVCAAQGGTVWVARSAHSNPNHTFNERNTTDLFTQEYGSTEFKPVGTTSNWVYNALAHNPKDGYLYAISQGRVKTIRSTANDGSSDQGVTYDEDPRYPAGHLLRINPLNGVVKDMGKIEGIQSKTPGHWPNDLWGGITSGVIRADGKYVFSNSSDSGTKDIYVLNWNATNKTYKLTATRKNAWRAQANDYTYVGDGSGNWVYGIRNGSSTLERVNIETGAVQTFDLSTVRDPLGRSFTSGIYGTAWTYGNGNLGFGRNGQQKGYQIRIIDGGSQGFRAEIVAEVPMPNSQSNDAASNAIVSSRTDLQATKKRLEVEKDGTVTWEVTVENLGPCGSTGFTLNDLVPNDYQDIRVLDAKSDAAPGWIGQKENWVNGNQVLAIHGPLAAKDKATVTIQAKLKQPLPGGSEGKCGAGPATPPNKVTILGNDGDDNPGNNTDVPDEQSGGSEDCGIKFNLIKVEANGQKTPLTGAKFAIHAVQPDGSLGELLTAMDQTNAEGYFTAELEPGQDYFLVETQSPAGYSLLTAPVKFRLNGPSAGQQNASVEVAAGGAAVNLLAVHEKQSPSEVYVELANVRQGNLPKTGGHGVQVPLAVSSILILLGAALGRRRTMQA